MLQPDGPSANLAGAYALTLTADSACTNLPAAARMRRYTAVMTPGYRPTTFVGRLSDARIVASAFSPFLEVSVASDFASVTLGMVERVDETTYLAIQGRAEATIGPSGIDAPFNAGVLLCPAPPEWTAGEYWACAGGVQGVECNAANHQFTLVRR